MSCRPSPATALKATIVGNAETAAELVAFLTSEGVAGVGVEGDARDGGDTTLIKYDLRLLILSRRRPSRATRPPNTLVVGTALSIRLPATVPTIHADVCGNIYYYYMHITIKSINLKQ